MQYTWLAAAADQHAKEATRILTGTDFASAGPVCQPCLPLPVLLLSAHAVGRHPDKFALSQSVLQPAGIQNTTS